MALDGMQKAAIGVFALAAVVVVGALVASGGGGDDKKGDGGIFGREPTTAAQLPTPAPRATVNPTAVAAQPDSLVFVSDRNGHLDIYRMNADGTGQMRLGQSPAANQLPNAGGDGSRIVFVSDRDGAGASEIYTMNQDGSAQTRIPTVDPATPGSALKFEPDISPDGKRLVFEVKRGDNYDVFTANIDGSNLVNLTNSPTADIDPVWSPDGNRIAFGSDRDGNMDIWVMDANGANPRKVASSPGFDGEPSWAPDSHHIAFGSNRDGNFNIYMVNDDGTGLRQLTNEPGDENDPSWSRDGTSIAYTGIVNGNADVFVLSAISAAFPVPTKNVTNSPSADFKPAWIRSR